MSLSKKQLLNAIRTDNFDAIKSKLFNYELQPRILMCMEFAAKNNKFDIVIEILQTNIISLTKTVLFHAVKHRSESFYKFLESNEQLLLKDITTYIILRELVLQNKTLLFKKLYFTPNHGIFNNLYYEASERNNYEIMKFMIQQGIPDNENQIIFCIHKLFLTKDHNLIEFGYNHIGHDKYIIYLISWQSSYMKLDTLKFLQSLGLNIHSEYKDRTLLDNFINSQNLEIIEYLIKLKVKLTEEREVSPYYSEVFFLLLQYGYYTFKNDNREEIIIRFNLILFRREYNVNSESTFNRNFTRLTLCEPKLLDMVFDFLYL